jgi:hypothetical protein
MEPKGEVREIEFSLGIGVDKAPEVIENKI